MLTLLPKGVQQKKMKTFLIEDFFHFLHFHLCFTLSCEYLREFLKKIRNDTNGIIRGLGETDPCRKPEVENLVALYLSKGQSSLSTNPGTVPEGNGGWTRGKG